VVYLSGACTSANRTAGITGQDTTGHAGREKAEPSLAGSNITALTTAISAPDKGLIAISKT